MEARIICLKSDLYTICDLETKNIYYAKASGLFRYKKTSPKVGDIVVYEILDDKNAYIKELKPRTNDLVRPAICNIDQAIVAMSVKEPIFNDNLLDRFLSILEFNNINSIIIFTKWDLLSKDEEEHMNKIFDYYQSIGYTCLKTSTKQNIFDNNKIIDFIKNKVSVITGQSGVGKSSLLNNLVPELKLETNDISKALGRGKHTTRHVELINIFDGYLADTPGFGTMDFSGMTEIDIAHSFKEFFALSEHCKYNGCLHLKEPNCEIKNKVESGNILVSRYQNYLQFIEESKNLRKW